MAQCIHCGKTIEELSACREQICMECCYQCFHTILSCEAIDIAERELRERNNKSGRHTGPDFRTALP